ncbi:MAG: T9SS type A sorting domain-containing protein [Bacteroidales bacterium]|nr:T9SS type A sorting domain-containing protein [Bacteroidales bacterium]
MKRNKILFIISVFLLFSLISRAQTDPGTANLTHQWTFDDGTANDVVTTNPVNGTLTGGATIENNALVLSAQGQYLSFSGSALALNTYSVISQEIWYTPVSGANTDYTMLSYFGTASSSMGYNYIFTSSARGDNVSRTCISNGTYDSEIGANGPEYDDGILHHMVSVIRSDSVILYIDGALVSKKANTIPLSTINTAMAYLGKSGYSNDPTWIGYISKFSIYNKSLSLSEVKYLYQQGAEQSQMITSTVSALSFDEFYTSQTITVLAQNISDTIEITVPTGITVTPSFVLPDVSNALITVNYDTAFTVDGDIVFTSDSADLTIPVKSFRNSCYSPLYPNAVNLVADPYISSLDSFSGWGNRSINNNPDYLYCGATSGKVNNGSLDLVLTGVMKPTTTYRIKAKVYKESPVTDENMGNVTYTLDLDSASYPVQYQLIKIAMDSACYYYSKYTPFIYNIHVYYDAGIPTAQASYHGSIGFGSNTTYMWVGTAMHEMAHYFGSGTSTAYSNLMVGGVWTGTVAKNLLLSLTGETLKGDGTHFWPYGINYKTEITNLGSMENQRKALITHAKIVKAMLVDDCNLPTNNIPVGVGVFGWDVSSDDVYHEVEISNSWQDIDFTFTTGPTLKTNQRIYFNSGVGYIDNWEMYEIIPDNILQQTYPLNQNIYFSDSKLSTELELTKESMVQIMIYDIQGKQVNNGIYLYEAGLSKKSFDVSLPPGIYIIQLISDEFTVSKKVICF